MTDTIEVVQIETLAPGLSVISRTEFKAGGTLKGLQTAIGGLVDCFDIVHPRTGAIATVWFHDEGKINGLPVNHEAMAVAIVGGWRGPLFGDWIAGPVVLTGFDPTEGETIALPPEWMEVIAALA